VVEAEAQAVYPGSVSLVAVTVTVGSTAPSVRMS